MKKSEMVENIVKVLRGCYPQYLDNQSNYSVRIDAEYVLDELQNYGMMPPQRTEEEKHYFANGEKWHTSEFIEFHCRWDEEND